MIRLSISLLALALLLVGCGRYGPPVRADAPAASEEEEERREQAPP